MLSLHDLRIMKLLSQMQAPGLYCLGAPTLGRVWLEWTYVSSSAIPALLLVVAFLEKTDPFSYTKQSSLAYVQAMVLSFILVFLNLCLGL